MKTPLAIITVLLLLLSAPTRANDKLTGVALVEKEVPELLQALTEISGEAVAYQFLQHWTLADVQIFQQGVSPSISWLRQQPSFFRHRDTRQVIGPFGEPFGTAALRSWIGRHPGFRLVSRMEYQTLNPQAGKPDGLVYAIEPRGLVLRAVLDSKMGGALFDPAQAMVYLRAWQERGLRVGKNPKDVYAPFEIFFATPSGLTPINSVTQELLKIRTLLVTSQPQPNFDGSVLTTPMDNAALYNVVYRYISLSTGLPHRLDLKTLKKIPVPFIYLGEEDLAVNFGVYLFRWLMENKTWPKSFQRGIFEKALAKTIRRSGGQAKVFLQFGPRSHRELAMSGIGVLPVEAQMRNTLLQTEPHNNVSAISMAQVYIQAYETPDHTPLVTFLRKHSEAWRAYFDEYGECQFYVAAL